MFLNFLQMDTSAIRALLLVRGNLVKVTKLIRFKDVYIESILSVTRVILLQTVKLWSSF